MGAGTIELGVCDMVPGWKRGGRMRLYWYMIRRCFESRGWVKPFRKEGI